MIYLEVRLSTYGGNVEDGEMITIDGSTNTIQIFPRNGGIEIDIIWEDLHMNRRGSRTEDHSQSNQRLKSVKLVTGSA